MSWSRRVVCGLVALSLVCFSLVPGIATAQSPDAPAAACPTYYGESRIPPGPFDRLDDEVAYLESNVDGAAIQIGLARPDAPPGYRSPVVAFAGPYMTADLEDISLEQCMPFLVKNFVSHGYTIALIPVRGSGNSGGCPDLMGPSERSDLDQAVTWLGTRAWSNGNVGMFGQSYDGSTPFEVASTGNPYLKTIVPVSGISDLYELIYGRGTYDWRWWIFPPDFYYAEGGVVLHNPSTGRDADRTVEAAVCPGFAQAVAASLESFLTAQPDAGGYWADRQLRPSIEKNYRGSIFFIQPLQDSQVRADHNIPWIYQLRARGVYVKQLLNQSSHSLPDYEATAGIGMRWDFASLLLNWFERWLKDDRSAKLGAQVEIQDSDGRWRTVRSWPPPNTSALFLSSGGRLSDEPRGERSSQLLAPDQRSRYYFFINRAPLETNDDWMPVPPALDRVCVTCALFRMPVTNTLRLSGIPSVHVQVTPSGSAGHVSAFLYAYDEKNDSMRRLGWGQTDLRFPDGGNEMKPVVAGQAMKLTIDLVPLDVVFHKGEEMVLVLGQGHADQMPTPGSSPVDLEYGKELGRFEFAEIQPSPKSFFVPPKTAKW